MSCDEWYQSVARPYQQCLQRRWGEGKAMHTNQTTRIGSGRGKRENPTPTDHPKSYEAMFSHQA
jgi:hypothetical protein